MSENNTQALEKVDGTALANYGERNEIRELSDRMMAFHPAYEDVGKSGMIAAAQLAIMSGANPLPTTGEIHIWKDWKGKNVVMLGIAFWRRKAREVDTPIWYIDNEDTDQTRRVYEPRTMVGEERQQYHILAGDVASICKAYRLSEYLKLVESGVPWLVAQQMVCRTGIGVIKKADMVARKATKSRAKGDPIDPPNGRTWEWVANKRAEQDVYRALSLINENFASKQPSNIRILEFNDDAETEEVSSQPLLEPPPSPDWEEEYGDNDDLFTYE